MISTNRIDELLEFFVPVFNDHQTINGDYDLIMTIEQAKKSGYFWQWCVIWGDDDERGELADLLRGK
jgi:hypothetical protein